MPAGPIPQHEMNRVQGELAQAAMLAAPPPANLEAATTLHDTGEVRYRGRAYRVPPVPVVQGMRLQALDFELRQLDLYAPTEEVLQQAVAVVEAMVAIFWALVKEPWYRRLWPWRANPFRDVEEDERRALLDFFCSARTRYPVRLTVSLRAPAWVQPTWLTHSPSLRVGIRAGWRQTAIPAAIATSNWGSPGWLMNPSVALGSPAT